MAKPYIPDPNTITAAGAFTPWPRLDRANDHAPIIETFTVPGSANEYCIRLDYAILAQASLSIENTSTNSEYAVVPWETTPGPGQVAVFKDRGLLRFHSGAEGDNVEVNYQPLGSVVDAQFEMTLQKYVQNAPAVKARGTVTITYDNDYINVSPIPDGITTESVIICTALSDSTISANAVIDEANDRIRIFTDVNVSADTEINWAVV